MDPQKNTTLMDYFKAVADRNGKYHDHKEVSAWAGIVLHLVFCSALLRIDIPDSYRQLAFVLVVVGIFTEGVFAYLFIRQQLDLKDLGGAMHGAAIYYMSAIVTNPDRDIEEISAPPVQSAHVDTHTQASYIFPPWLLKRRDLINTQGLGAQRALRHYIYGILIVASLFAIGVNAIRLLGDPAQFIPPASSSAKQSAQTPQTQPASPSQVVNANPNISIQIGTTEHKVPQIQPKPSCLSAPRPAACK